MRKYFYLSVLVLFIFSCDQSKKMTENSTENVELITTEQAVKDNLFASRYFKKGNEQRVSFWRYDYSFPQRLGWTPVSITVGRKTAKAILGDKIGEIQTVHAKFSPEQIAALDDNQKNTIIFEVIVDGANKSFKLEEVALIME